MKKIDKKILIVEDSKNYLWILKQALIAEGFSVVSAENGEDGLVAAKEEKPDLILSDITMPKMDGLAMSKKLKEDNIKIPIILLTNMSDMKSMTSGSDLADGYIIKSDLNVDEIIAKVKEKLNLK